MRIATFLPHVGVFGGVRRFLELGNRWVRMGHDVTLFHPTGESPDWFRYEGRVAPLPAAADSSSDLAFGADPHTLDALSAHHSAERVYYAVLWGDPGIARAARAGLRLAANSSAQRRALARTARREVLDGVGGIDVERFRPDVSQRRASPLRVLVNGRRSRSKKGTDLILEALRGLRGRAPEFEIVLFDHVDPHNRQDPRDGAPLPPNARYVINPSQEELVSLYQSADLFVAAERKAGWCNTAIEALACGCALVCTASGTRDFARDGGNALVAWRHPFFLRRAAARLLRQPELRERLARAGPSSAAPWSWDRLAVKLLAQLGA